MRAVVLGGGRPDDPLAAAHKVPVKALVPLAGRPMAWHVLRALRGGGVEEIVYVGPTTPELTPLVDAALPDAGGMLENLAAGMAALPGNPRVLVATADVPMLTGEAVRDLLARDPGAGIVYPVVPAADALAAYPGGRRTFARVREGRFTGGNLFILDSGLLAAAMPHLREAIARRKSPLALASMIGWGTVLRFLAGALTIPELEARVSDIIGVPARALITRHAEVGADVDRPEDLETARRALEKGHG